MQRYPLERSLVAADRDRAEVGVNVVVGLVFEEEVLEESLPDRPLEAGAAEVPHRPHERRGGGRLRIVLISYSPPSLLRVRLRSRPGQRP